MAKDMNLTAQEIYEKEFHVDLKGYAPAEVDEFLDMVIEDYQKYENLNEKVNSDFVNGSSNTVDILKRIARLEKAVFNQSEE